MCLKRATAHPNLDGFKQLVMDETNNDGLVILLKRQKSLNLTFFAVFESSNKMNKPWPNYAD